jgi:hypothetical protein
MVDPLFKSVVKNTRKWMNTVAGHHKVSFMLNPYKEHTCDQWTKIVDTDIKFDVITKNFEAHRAKTW